MLGSTVPAPPCSTARSAGHRAERRRWPGFDRPTGRRASCSCRRCWGRSPPRTRPATDREMSSTSTLAPARTQRSWACRVTGHRARTAGQQPQEERTANQRRQDTDRQPAGETTVRASASATPRRHRRTAAAAGSKVRCRPHSRRTSGATRPTKPTVPDRHAGADRQRHLPVKAPLQSFDIDADMARPALFAGRAPAHRADAAGSNVGTAIASTSVGRMATWWSHAPPKPPMVQKSVAARRRRTPAC